ncbi:hypothetical protein D3C72_2086570 [compost metagenome]
MDVVHAGADLIGILKVLEGVEQLHVRARGFDGDHIGIHVGNRCNDVVELRIAHMGVDLRFVAHATHGNAEGLHGPVQVLLPL